MTDDGGIGGLTPDEELELDKLLGAGGPPLTQEDCWLLRLAWTFWAPFDLLWCWLRESAVDRDIEAQRRDLERLARKPAGKIETRHDDLLGGKP